MRVLLDECVHVGVKAAFPEGTTHTVPEMGWRTVQNGKLLALVHGNFDVFVTVDKNIEHQQRISRLQFGIVIVHVPRNEMRFFRPIFGKLLDTVRTIRPGQIVHVHG